MALTPTGSYTPTTYGASTAADAGGGAGAASFSMGMMGVGAFMSVLSAYQSSKAMKSNLRFSAEMAKINAEIAELSAQQTLLAGQRQHGASRLRYGQLKGAQRAALAANGVDLGEGNAAEVQASSELLAEIDANQITANAVQAAWGYRTQGTNYENKARMDEATASGISPGLNATSSLVTNAGNVAGNWYVLNKAGAFNSPTNG